MNHFQKNVKFLACTLAVTALIEVTIKISNSATALLTDCRLLREPLLLSGVKLVTLIVIEFTSGDLANITCNSSSKILALAIKISLEGSNNSSF